MHLAVCVNILYCIGVSFRRIQRFGSLKPLFSETGSQSTATSRNSKNNNNGGLHACVHAAEATEPISFTNFTSFSCCCVGFLYSVQGLCACSKSSSPFLVYFCGRITAPHTGLACILHRFESVSVVSCVRRYFLRWRCVYGRTRKKRSDRESSGFVWMSPYWLLSGCEETFNQHNKKCFWTKSPTLPLRNNIHIN